MSMGKISESPLFKKKVTKNETNYTQLRDGGKGNPFLQPTLPASGILKEVYMSLRKFCFLSFLGPY